MKSIFGWIFTLIIVGSLSALLMVLGIRTPNVRSAANINSAEKAVAAGGASALAGLAASGCPPSAAMEVRIPLLLHCGLQYKVVYLQHLHLRYFSCSTSMLCIRNSFLHDKDWY